MHKWIEEVWVRLLTAQERHLAQTLHTDTSACAAQALEECIENGDTLFVWYPGRMDADLSQDQSEMAAPQLFCLLSEHYNDWSGGCEGFVHTLGAVPNIPSEALDAITGELVSVARECGYDLLRLELKETERVEQIEHHLRSRGWQTIGAITCYTPGGAPVPGYKASFGGSVRPAEAEDMDFVYSLMAEAVWAGMNNAEQSRLNFDQVAANVRGEFEEAFADGTCQSLVALVDGVRVGHAVYYLGSFDPLLATSEAYLWDIFVLPEWAGRGVGESLTTCCISACVQAGVCLIRSKVVFENSGPDRAREISSYLARQGWWVSSRLLYLPLN